MANPKELLQFSIEITRIQEQSFGLFAFHRLYKRDFG